MRRPLAPATFNAQLGEKLKICESMISHPFLIALAFPDNAHFQILRELIEVFRSPSENHRGLTTPSEKPDAPTKFGTDPKNSCISLECPLVSFKERQRLNHSRRAILRPDAGLPIQTPKTRFSEGNLIPECNVCESGAGFPNADSEIQVFGRRSDRREQFLASGK